eukprot:PhM_4_TR15176/c0_g1_i3/m.66944
MSLFNSIVFGAADDTDRENEGISTSNSDNNNNDDIDDENNVLKHFHFESYFAKRHQRLHERQKRGADTAESSINTGHAGYRRDVDVCVVEIPFVAQQINSFKHRRNGNHRHRRRHRHQKNGNKDIKDHNDHTYQRGVDTDALQKALFSTECATKRLVALVAPYLNGSSNNNNNSTSSLLSSVVSALFESFTSPGHQKQQQYPQIASCITRNRRNNKDNGHHNNYGYQLMIKSHLSWGTAHFIRRGSDDPILTGDAFLPNENCFMLLRDDVVRSLDPTFGDDDSDDGVRRGVVDGRKVTTPQLRQIFHGMLRELNCITPSTPFLNLGMRSPMLSTLLREAERLTSILPNYLAQLELASARQPTATSENEAEEEEQDDDGIAEDNSNNDALFQPISKNEEDELLEAEMKSLREAVPSHCDPSDTPAVVVAKLNHLGATVVLVQRLIHALSSCTNRFMPLLEFLVSLRDTQISPQPVVFSKNKNEVFDVDDSNNITSMPESYLPAKSQDRYHGSLLQAIHIAVQRPRIVWGSLCCYCCGFAKEIVSLVIPVLSRVYEVTLPNTERCFCPGYGEDVTRRLQHITTSSIDMNDNNYGAVMSNAQMRLGPTIVVAHTNPMDYSMFKDEPRIDYFIGRSMHELEPIPKSWASRVNDQVDELWVPSTFSFESFVRAGVPADKIRLVPEAVDSEMYSPSWETVWNLPNDLQTKIDNATFYVKDSSTSTHEDSYFVFLSVFKWEERKGWDVLLRNYARAFSAKDAVVLIIVTHVFGTRASATSYRGPRDAEAIHSWCVREMLSVRPSSRDHPRVVVVTSPLSEQDMVTLYRSSNAFVLPTRGEGWGLPVIQAMSMGLPTITTNYSGMLTFATPETAYLIPVDGLEPVPTDSPGFLHLEVGQKWAVPNEQQLESMMKSVFYDRAKAAAVGAKARQHIVSQFSEAAVGALVVAEFQRIEHVMSQFSRKENNGY